MERSHAPATVDRRPQRRGESEVFDGEGSLSALYPKDSSFDVGPAAIWAIVLSVTTEKS